MFFPDVGRTSRERRSDHQEVALTVPQTCGFRVHVFLCFGVCSEEEVK